MGKNKLDEVIEELRTVVFTGRSGIIDSIIPPIAFVIVNAVSDVDAAIIASFAIALAISIYRLLRRQPLTFALGGIGSVIIAAALAKFIGKAEGFFLPGLISGIITVILCIASLIARKPIVAWTSHFARSWPLEWYWHPQVRPAYNEVTIAWTGFFIVRLALELELILIEQPTLVAIFNIVSGWPALIVLLIVSYLYGVWRLQQLKGPSVEEFTRGDPPPWASQERGF
jgi:hypothetical protein